MDAKTGFHVLAVDDTATDRMIIERFLKKSSCNVIAVDSGIKALELLGLDDDSENRRDHQKIDMIITDYCMPGLTGYELLMKVKGSENLKDIPVQHHVEMLKPYLLKSKACRDSAKDGEED
ncbi:hypothetical protein V2J09_017563 [Rumex salicifolius]